MAKKISSKDAAKSLLENISKPAAKDTILPETNQKSESINMHNFDTEKKQLKQKSVYLTEQQIKAIKLKTIQSDSSDHKDDSAVIRAAINAYLGL